MKTTKEKIQEKRGKIKRGRKKKFQYLKHTNQFDNYYNQKHKEVEVIKKISKKLKWYQRLWRWIRCKLRLK